MTRILLIMYLMLTMGMGPRVCCVAGDVVNAGTKMLAAIPTHNRCCAKPMTPPEKSGQPDQAPGHCHNLQREGIEAVKTIPPTHADVAIVPFLPLPTEFVAETIGIVFFFPPEARDKLSLFQVLRC